MHIHKWEYITVTENKTFEYVKYTDKEIKYKKCQKCNIVKHKYYILGLKFWVRLEKSKEIIVKNLLIKSADGLSIIHKL